MRIRLTYIFQHGSGSLFEELLLDRHDRQYVYLAERVERSTRLRSTVLGTAFVQQSSERVDLFGRRDCSGSIVDRLYWAVGLREVQGLRPHYGQRE